MPSSFLFIFFFFFFLFHLPFCSTATFFGSSRFSNKKYFAHEFQEGKEKFLSQKTVTTVCDRGQREQHPRENENEKKRIYRVLGKFHSRQSAQSTCATATATTLYSLTTTTFAKYSTKCSCDDDRRKPNGHWCVRQARCTENNKNGKGFGNGHMDNKDA